ncbi:MAG: bifunctional phosphopantothenoylcysteine decarboxylase/phosphopantothenate--cysteine ligase CoaBC [Candidatus Firestonebacteria bacterium]
MLKGKNIVIGVCGGIAAYKVCTLVSRLKQAGAVVDVVMTKSACEFITPLTFQALSGRPVHTNMFELVKENNWKIDHIALAERADLLVIVPATANLLGKLAGGIADDLLTTTALAVKCPVLIVPAMNKNMWSNGIVRDNAKKLKSFGFEFCGPARGNLACGDSGEGRMEEPAVIFKEMQKLV